MIKVKNILAAALLVTVASVTAQAQFYVGPRAGVNLSNMSWNTAQTENLSIMGYHGGATGRWQFSNNFSVQMDGMISLMGNTQKLEVASGDPNITDEITTEIMYVQAPLYINYERPIMPDNLVPYRVKESSVSFHAFGGGYFGYALSASQGKETTTVSGGNTTVDPAVMAEMTTDTYNAIDFGIMAGIGFSFKLDEDKMNRLGVDFRYLMGFSDFDKGATYSATNSAVQASVYFSRKLTKRKYTTRKKW